jgi:hypothetical protein
MRGLYLFINPNITLKGLLLVSVRVAFQFNYTNQWFFLGKSILIHIPLSEVSILDTAGKFLVQIEQVQFYESL